MVKRTCIASLLGCVLALPASAEDANTAWQGVWDFQSPSERSVNLRAAELIELKQGGRLERRRREINSQQVFCNANARTGNRNRGEPAGNVNRQGAGNAAVSGCAVEGGSFAPSTENRNAGDEQPADQQFENVLQK
jgi:hypothetical protein